MVVLHATDSYVILSYFGEMGYSFIKRTSPTRPLRECPRVTLQGDDALGFREDLRMAMWTNPTLSLNDQLEFLWNQPGYAPLAQCA